MPPSMRTDQPRPFPRAPEAQGDVLRQVGSMRAVILGGKSAKKDFLFDMNHTDSQSLEKIFGPLNRT